MKVEFIILNPTAKRHRDAVLAELIEQHYLRDEKVALFCNDADRLRWLDRVIWTFDAKSFIAHRVTQQKEAFSQHVNEVLLIDDLLNLPDDVDVLFIESAVNTIPQNPSHIVEVIGNKDDQVVAGRQRFAHYRDAGFKPTILKVD